jgi:hypothetical protein
MATGGKTRKADNIINTVTFGDILSVYMLTEFNSQTALHKDSSLWIL